MRAQVRYWLAPDRPAIEMIAADYDAQRFRPHWHSGYTVGVVTRNRQGFKCRDRAWEAGIGDVILVNAGETHDGYAIDGKGWSTRMAYLPVPVLRELMSTGELDSAFSPGFALCSVNDPNLYGLFVEWHTASDANDVLLAAETCSKFMTALEAYVEPGMIFADKDGLRFGPDGNSRLTLTDSAQVPPDVQSPMACSRTTSWRRIRSNFGLSRTPLLSQLRLMSAKKRLSEGAPIIDAALDCGFYDQSHLSREFVAAYGMTAGQFRKVQMKWQKDKYKKLG
jgi:AraC-like DNA-binding protein